VQPPILSTEYTQCTLPCKEKTWDLSATSFGRYYRPRTRQFVMFFKNSIIRLRVELGFRLVSSISKDLLIASLTNDRPKTTTPSTKAPVPERSVAGEKWGV
jgi:hypothetical protein